MEAPKPASELAIYANEYINKAWCVAAVLLSIGRPVTLTELAGKCTILLFRTSPEFIEFLCFIPNSPLFMTRNGVVLLSASAFRAVTEYFGSRISDLWRRKFMCGILPLVNDRVTFRPIEGNALEKEIFREFSAVSMRKVQISEFGIGIVPSVKSRPVLKLIEENELEKEDFVSNDRTALALKALPLDMPKEVAVMPVRNLNDMVVTRSMENSRNGCDKVVVVKYFRKRKKFGGEVAQPVKKRADLRLTKGNEQEGIGSSRRIVLSLNALPHQPVDIPREAALGNVCDEAVTPAVVNSSIGLLEHQSKNNEDQGSEIKLKASEANDMHNNEATERCREECNNNIGTTLDMSEEHAGGRVALLVENLAEISASQGVDKLDSVDLMAKMDTSASSFINFDQHDKNTSARGTLALHSHKYFTNKNIHVTKVDDMVEMPLNDYVFPEGTAEKEKLSLGSCGVDSFIEDLMGLTSMEASKRSTLGEDVASSKASNRTLAPTKSQSSSRKTFSKISAFQKNVHKQSPTLKQEPRPMLQNDNNIFHKERKHPKDHNTSAFRVNNEGAQVNCVNKSLKEQQKSKYPEFESYIVEEEVGAGGYGTVYRARRKTDGVTFAIKCPHGNARIQHFKNELKMQQRFGGKNFVIKYEASLKSGNTDCFVLEHDRPEILRKEIDIRQLQWYGFCLFKALSSLHKQGVFHRDIKPGNFLFSCKTNRGYLIDFNLAKDLHQKPGSPEKSQHSYTTAMDRVPKPQPSTFASSNKRRKILSGKPSEALGTGARSGTINHTLENKTLKRKAVDKLKAYDDLGRGPRGNSITSQGADASGLTSKDLTSARTSRERLTEPIPCQVRKELINLAQEAMLTPKIGIGNAPMSKRKRISASPVVMDSKFVYVSPIPLHSSGKCFSGAGSMNNRGDVKPHKEGPCVGTKGFRAPEVLLQSMYQGPKIDVWSAGVTLLYLITGKMPFTGDPQQNMKDIVKMKGNEELWEVARLHNREFSIPMELLDIKFLRSMTIKEWCVANTKRMSFLDSIPSSLFDLIEKCLVVNPRSRITAEKAFKHEFFAPCHDVLQKMKLHKPPQNHQPSLS